MAVLGKLVKFCLDEQVVPLCMFEYLTSMEKWLSAEAMKESKAGASGMHLRRSIYSTHGIVS